MINRLRVYWETHARSRPSPASENFNRTLIKLQSHILGFLARAIRVQRMRGASKLAQIIWDNDNLTQFENTCNSLCIRASEEARICDSEQGEQWREEFSRQLKGLDEIHGVRTDLEKLYDKVDITRLLIAGNAVYNSSAEADQCRCMPGTRTELLESITAWAVHPSSKPIFWLCGKAGTGKSTVARSVAHKLEEKGLHGATFFFKRGQTDRTHSNLLIPTIVSQLADTIPEIRHPIAGALDRDSLLCHKNMRSQFHKLMSQPLQQAQWDSISSAGIILVIDALDECDNGEDMKSFLLLVSRVQTETIVPLRTFVTSRPELPIELGFKDMPGNLHHEVRLEEVQSTTIKRDIRIFYESQLHDIRENSALYGDELPCNWPSDGSINFLVEQTAPLFILASTICRYISADPLKNLAMIMQHGRINPSIGLQTTYLPILESISGETNGSQRKQKLVDFKNVVGSIILLLDPLSASALTKLLGVRVGEIGRVLRPLHSVLSIPRAADGRFDYNAPITVFHQSFADYLIDPELDLDNPFMIDVAGTHDMLGLRCIRLLEAGCLREDICGVSHPGIRRQSVTASIIGTALPDDIIYCCRHWHWHFIRSGRPIEDEGSVHQFLRKHLLHWMEALGWLGNMSDVFRSLEDLRSAVNVRRDPKICNQSDMLTSSAKGTSGKELLLLLTDACKFATRNRYIIDQAPL